MDDAFKQFKEQVFNNGKPKKPKEYTLVKAENVAARPKDWIWEGHLLRGALQLITGIPGLGKSMVQISFVACVTTNQPWPNDDDSGPPANVIMLTAEDSLDQELIPRLRAAGADLERVRILKCIRSDERDRQFLLSEDLDIIERVVAEVGNVALITIDPITAYMGMIDSHKTTEVRSQLGPLKDIAEKLNVAISAITHPPKSSSHKAIDWFIGSQGFIAAARIGEVCVAEIEEDEHGNKVETGHVLFANVKNNPNERMPTLAFRKESFDLHGGPDDPWNLIKTARVVWEKAEVDISADEAIRAAATTARSKARGKQTEVQEFLQEILKSGDQVAVIHIFKEGEKRGYSERQLKIAKQHLKVESGKTKDGWFWWLPGKF
jgi:putative DNA primase/helicase